MSTFSRQAQLRIGGQIIEKGSIPLAINETGAFAMDLMGHSSGAEHNDLEIPLIAGDRAAESSAKRETTTTARLRVENDVDLDRYYLARPF